MKRIDVDLASGLQAFEAKHFTRAMQLLSPLAEEGNLEAQHRCAIMYQNGLGNKEFQIYVNADVDEFIAVVPV